MLDGSCLVLLGFNAAGFMFYVLYYIYFPIGGFMMCAFLLPALLLSAVYLSVYCGTAAWSPKHISPSGIK